jgi:carboxypeptidase family protein
MRVASHVVLVAILVVPSTLVAQGLRGRVFGVDGAPIPGAIVTLVDTGGATVARVLSSPIGSYLVRAPRAGTYSLRVLRIGFPAFTAPAVTLALGAAVEFTPTLPQDPIVLNDIEITGGGACSNGAEGGATATLLEEVRKAFGSMELALRDRDLRFLVDRYIRRSDKREIVTAADSATQSMTTWPVHSLPAEALARGGFVQAADSVDPGFVPLGAAEGRIWFGPDPATLFAEPFLATHCFRVIVDRGDRDRVGLAFAPVRGRRMSEIEGTLWLRRSTLALERLEYEYRNLPRHLAGTRSKGAGGTMEFVRLPRGLWIVSRWDLRVPIEEYHNNAPVGVAGWLDEGGRIKSIRTVQGVEVY